MISPPSSWGNLQNKPAILSDNQISWDEVFNNPLRSLNGGLINLSLGSAFNSAFLPSAIEIPTHPDYDGGYPYHTGVALACGGMSAWGDAKLKIYVSNSWGQYMETPCLNVGNYVLESSGTIKGVNFQATNLTTAPDGLSTGTFYRDANGFVKVVM